jgi:hypothetical protein
MTNEICILGIQITGRIKDISVVQNILTKFGCSIRTRLGLHRVEGEFCAKTGIILLELTGDKDERMKLENELLAVDGLSVKKMIFEEVTQA